MTALALPFRRSSFLNVILWLPLLLLVMLLEACAGLNPVAVAETPAQKYAAVKLTYDAVLTVGVQIVQDSTVPNEVRRPLQAAIAASGDVYRSANEAYVQFVAARGELATGQTSSAKLDIATANLEKWIGQLQTAGGRLAALAHR